MIQFAQLVSKPFDKKRLQVLPVVIYLTDLKTTCSRQSEPLEILKIIHNGAPAPQAE